MTVLFDLVLLPFFVFLVGELCSRLLGIRLGLIHSAVVGFVGWVAGVAGAAAAIGHNSSRGRALDLSGFDSYASALGVTVFFGVLAAMPAAILLDLLTRRTIHRPTHRALWLVHPIRRVRAALAPYGRMREVVAIARRANLLHWHNASHAALESPDLARKLRMVLEQSGGMLVKLGQIASTRGDILPPTMIEELASLRADVVPVDEAGVRGMLEAELGVPVEHAFQSFDWTPLAAASIGQTHRAVLHDGTRVVVKVQRPGVVDVMERDASVVRLVARQLERRVEAARTIGLRSLSDELIVGLEEELDYHHEALVATRLRERRAADVGIAVPRVYPTLSTGRVLVMEEVDARTIGDEKAVESCPVARHELAMRVLSSFVGQVLEDGFFHADPHPGNLLVDVAGTIWLLDFGSVGRLDSAALNGLRGVAIGIATNDAGMLARAARDLATAATVIDLRALEAELAAPLAELDEAGGINPQMIAHVLSVMQHHEMRPPASVTLLGRALVTLEGTLRVLEPDFSMADASKDLVRERRSAFGTPREILQREMLRVLPALRTLPEHAEAIASQLRGGSLTMRHERFAGGDRDVVDRWVDRAVLAGIGGFAGVTSALLLFAAAATENDKVQTALWILGFTGMALAAILMLRGAARALRRHATRLD